MRHVSDELKKITPDPLFRGKIRHPACVNFLLNHGIPNDMNDEVALSILAKYATAKGLDEKQEERMAQMMVRNTPSLGVKNDETSYREAKLHLASRKNHGVGAWKCRETLASKRLRDRRACDGWQCEYYSSSVGGEPYPQASTDETDTEQALLTYALSHPESITEGVQLKLQSESFVSVYTCRDGVPLLLNRALWHICCYLARQSKEVRISTVLRLLSQHSGMQPYLDEITRYVQDVSSRHPCRRDAFLKRVSQVRERGLEQHVQALVYAASSALRSRTLPLDTILHALEEQAHSLSVTIDGVINKLDDDLANLIETFLLAERRVIPTSSSWLNDVLDGGWKPGSVYAVSAFCDVEATDFAAWCIDYAAWCGHPTLYVSYSKSRHDMGLQALARHGSVETTDLSTQGGRTFDPKESKAVLERLVSGGERLSKRIAQHVWTLQADDQTSIADIGRATRAVQYHDVSGRDKSALALIEHVPAAKPPNRKRLASGNGKRMPWEEGSMLAALKRSMPHSNVAIVAVFVADMTKGERRGSARLSSSATSLKQSKRLGVADYTLTLLPHHVEMEGLNGWRTVDQLEIAREWYKRKHSEHRERIQCSFDVLRNEHPADSATSRYARIALRKKGGTVLSNPLLLYEHSLRRFRPVDIEPINFEERIRAPPKTHDDEPPWPSV